MKLYKFRAIKDCDSFLKAADILLTGRFWCSRFWEMNDPMEGVFVFRQSDGIVAKALLSTKAELVICSFSSKKALAEPLMWGHYGNGFRGMAVEVEIKHSDVRRVVPVKRAHS